MTDPLLVSVVDDDESVRGSLPDLLREFGFAAQTFSSAEEFLAPDYLTRTKCLILDVAMPGMSWPDLQRELMPAAGPDRLRHRTRGSIELSTPRRAGCGRLSA